MLDGRRQLEQGILGPGVPAVQRRRGQLSAAERDPQRYGTIARAGGEAGVGAGRGRRQIPGRHHPRQPQARRQSHIRQGLPAGIDDPRIRRSFCRSSRPSSLRRRRPIRCRVRHVGEVTRATVSGPDRRLKLIARFGVGYDIVDVPALTESGVMLTITPDGVRRPVATAALTFVLMLAHRVPIKDRLVREGRWAERVNHMGTGLSGRTLGSIGVGNIGSELFRLATPFAMRHLACDPYVTQESVAPAGRHAGGLGHAVARGRLRVRELSAERGDAPPGRRKTVRADEADGVFRQHGARTDRGREGALRCADERPDRGGGDRRVRAGAYAGRQPIAQIGQYRRHPALHLPHRRVHQHRDRQCVQCLPRLGLRTRAQERREPAGAGTSSILPRMDREGREKKKGRQGPPRRIAALYALGSRRAPGAAALVPGDTPDTSFTLHFSPFTSFR